MKAKFKSLFFLSAIGYSLAAQVPESPVTTPVKKPRFETGLNLYTLDASGPLNRSYDNGYGPGLENLYCNGIFFKYFKGQGGVRFSANYYQRVMGFQYNDYTFGPYGYHYGVSKATELNIGYQYLFTKGAISPYVFTEIKYQIGYEKGVQSCPMCTRLESSAQPLIWMSPEYSFTETMMGLNHGLGLRMSIKDRIVVNIETSISYAASIRKYDNEIRSHTRYALGAKPIRLSVGILF